MLHSHDKIIITGAAGLVGQNLVLLLSEQGYTNIIAIDKHHKNLQLLKKLNPMIEILHEDLAEKGAWHEYFKNAKYAVLLHAQITGLDGNDFIRNNIQATKNVIETIRQYQIPYVVHISSSVVNSVADDYYTRTKTEQEQLIINSDLKYTILRPTLMFGWFDPKHLGWLSRFMEKTFLFPIPGNGKFLRQPLYSRDFCKIILAVMQQQPNCEIFDIVGQENVEYIEIIKAIKKAKGLKTPIIKIPYQLFYFLLKIYGMINKKPPFTIDQLKALTAGDYFTGINFEKRFGVIPTNFSKAIDETFNDPKYSSLTINS